MTNTLKTLTLCVLSAFPLSLLSMDVPLALPVNQEKAMFTLQTDTATFQVPARHVALCKTLATGLDFAEDATEERALFCPAIQSSAWRLLEPQLETILQLTRIKKQVKQFKTERWFIFCSGQKNWAYRPRDIKRWPALQKKYNFETMDPETIIAQRKEKEDALIAAKEQRGACYTLLYDAYKDLSTAQLISLLETADFCGIQAVQPLLIALALSIPTEKQTDEQAEEQTEEQEGALNPTLETIITRKKDGPGRTTILHWACSRGLLPVVQDLIERKKMALEETIDWGKTPLICAVEKGQLSVAAYLLKQGASINCLSNGETSLALACSIGHLELVNLLLNYHTDNNYKLMNSDNTLMHFACRGGNRAVAERIYAHLSSSFPLIRLGLVSRKNNEGQTPLFLAARAGRTECLRYMIDRGETVNTQDSVGRTPLHAACDSSSEVILPVIRLLVESGASLNATESSGYTPVHLACSTAPLSTIRYLASVDGVNWAIRNKFGKTPLSEACSWGKIKTVRFLMDECGRGFDDIDTLKIEELRSQKVREYLLAKQAALKK